MPESSRTPRARPLKASAAVAAVATGAVFAIAFASDRDRSQAQAAAPAGATQVVAHQPQSAGQQRASANKTWNERAVRASRTAANALRGGRAYDLEYVRGRWEVKAADLSRRVTSFEIDRAGTRILAHHRDRNTDNDERRDVRRARTAKTSMAAAIRTAAARGEGRIDEAEIERHRGQTTWQVTYGERDETAVYVSTSTGKIVDVVVDRDRDDD